MDADRNGENIREEVLIVESLVRITKDSKGTVVAGLCVGPYAWFVTRNPPLSILSAWSRFAECTRPVPMRGQSTRNPATRWLRSII